MQKQKTFPRYNISIEGMKKVHEAFYLQVGPRTASHTWEVSSGGAMWTFDTFDEFIADYTPESLFQYVATVGATSTLPPEQLMILRKLPITALTISVQSNNRGRIQELSNIIEQSLQPFPPAAGVEEPELRIFIGHGGDPQWRELKDHLQDQHGYRVEAYETGARAGHTIRDILEDLLNSSSIAFLVLTGEDETAENTFRARQNVVHETGLFQGKLGFGKALILLEEGTEMFSNLDGIQQIRFSKGKIREAFGDVLATIKREFSPSSAPHAPAFTSVNR